MSVSRHRAPSAGYLLVCAALVSLTVYLFVAAARQAESHSSALASAVPPLSPVDACKAPPDLAGARGRELERLAHAHWERVPFDEREAPLACQTIDEAVRCYALAQDREGRARVEALHTRFSAELRARVERRRFLLAVARRNQDLEAVVRESVALLSLFSRSGDDAATYRASLAALARRTRARLLEAAMLEKDKS